MHSSQRVFIPPYQIILPSLVHLPPPPLKESLIPPPLPNIILPNPECSYADCFG